MKSNSITNSKIFQIFFATQESNHGHNQFEFTLKIKIKIQISKIDLLKQRTTNY